MWPRPGQVEIRGLAPTEWNQQDLTDMDETEHDDGDSGWGLTDWLIVFPLAGLATYMVRTRFGWGDAGWEDLVAYLVFSLVFGLIVEALRDLLRNRRSGGEAS